MQVYNNRSDYLAYGSPRAMLSMSYYSDSSPPRSDTISAFCFMTAYTLAAIAQIVPPHPSLQSPHPEVCIIRTNYFPFSKATFARTLFWLKLWLVRSFRTFVDPGLTINGCFRFTLALLALGEDPTYDFNLYSLANFLLDYMPESMRN